MGVAIKISTYITVYQLFFLCAVNMDYVVVNEALLFPSGSSSGPPPSQQCFFIQPIDDFNVEATEFYQLSATSPDPQAEFSPGADSARVDIIDNDCRFPYNTQYIRTAGLKIEKKVCT